MSSKAALREHILELRTRLLIICGAFLVWCGIGYVVRKPLTKALLQPLDQSVYYNSPQGGFEFFMRIIMTAGIICVVPIVIHQFIKFLEPALNKTISPRLMRRILFWSCALAAAGVTFGYIVVLPTTLQFFANFGAGIVKPLISADAYLTFVLGVLATFAVLFQLPLILSITDHIYPIKPEKLTKYRRHVLIGSLIIALILPFTYDPVTQLIMAAPIVVLYEVAILVVRYNHRQTRQQKRQQRIAQLASSMQEELRDVQKSDSQPTSQPKRPSVAADSITHDKPKPRPRVIDLRNI